MEASHTAQPPDDQEESAYREKQELELPLSDEEVAQLRVGDWIFLNGVIYMMSLPAMQRLEHALKSGEDLPFSLENQTIYHAVPTDTPLGKVIGSIGPARSAPYDEPSCALLRAGARMFIGCGPRNEMFSSHLKRNRGLYLLTTGGALLSQTVYLSEIVAYEDLGNEAIRRIKVNRFPAVVGMDGFGRNVFQRDHLSQNGEDTEKAEEEEAAAEATS